MRIQFHKNFKKQYEKLKENERKKAKERLALFSKDEFNLLLNNHPLKGYYKGYRSINIAGDLRAIYKRATKNARIVIFVAIDTHSNLYK